MLFSSGSRKPTELVKRSKNLLEHQSFDVSEATTPTTEEQLTTESDATDLGNWTCDSFDYCFHRADFCKFSAFTTARENQWPSLHGGKA